ncbi:MAG: Eco57I restriction-modification methylase domain-containing protein [Dolichospermum sp. DET50]|nr:Eco57I restriction-modification methylase domain-containing protein [Dolichospermum sp. DET66]MBS3033306.1 Eco57I restriction-modification methylase domain-containing protein [Dolichospermum sp. DET67]MBS3038510.1 Eco57I restriction-modification methylase domain-containing protein [Dolichospermum sp. DET50]QSX70389.1 MAG: Eco57I restriction-modification methylase domain-containing protein [Dolichospermum sp. DET69]
MTDTKNLNKPLFSQHYLKYRLQECLEWQLDINSDFEKLNKLYLSKKAILPTLNEAQTEDVFIKRVLDILGFKNIPQVVTRGKGRAERPDYALFANEEERDTAYTLQNNETAFYERVLVIAEAKYWERPLSKVSANDKRDIFKNENPSFQISSYLTGTNVDWGILTNGREWRLYYRQASSTATEFYPIDLVELLESEDLEKFKYFWLFFRSAAFEKDNYNKNFLERVREGSTTYATQVGNELKKLVFEQIFPDLAGGFVADAMRRGKTVESKQVYAATLSFLYKLLFLLYAEARNLLPITAAYRDYSLIKITQEIAESIDKEKTWSQTSTKIYKSLLGLFEIVDRGDPALEVPRYNGGLFHFDFHEVGDEKDYPDNYFLSQYQLSDAVLVSALDKLARFEQLPIDYSFLGVRQLGSIYEGLLEYRVVIEDESSGKAHLENDKGERKATGSYYTPDYIVKYIVSHTLKPILEERKQRFADLMTQITQLHEKFQDGRLGIQSRNGLQKDLQRLERKAQNTLLDIKICDPAMGSGHFLVEAVDYFTDELITILNEYPEHNPVLEMLKQTRESILGNLQQQGITIDVNKLEDTQLLQRVVMKRCIYGVDLNPMAVELAKVSLWLHSFTIGAPLSFLDHHLRCGNSLIGTTARKAEAKMQKEESGQLSLLTGPFVGLLLAAEIMRGVSTLSDATFAEVETSERLFKEFDKAAKPYKRLLDIYVSKYFGVKQADRFLRVYGINAINANPENMNTDDIAVYEDARKLFEEKRFFHWDLEFPEVFIDLENASWKENPGFDAVIGNPPYGDILDKKSKDYLITVTGMKTGGRAEIYTNFIVLSTHITKSYGYQSFIIPNTCLDGFQFSGFRKIITNSTEIVNIVDFRNKNVFNDADVITMIIVLKKIVDTEQLYYLTKYDIWDEDNQTFSLQDMEILINSENPWRSFNAIISKIENANICVKLEPEIATCHDAGVDYKWKNVGWQNRGEKSSLSELLFYHGTIKNQQDYQLLKGENINRYSIEYHDNYLIHDFEKYKNSQSVVAVYLDLNIVPTKIISRQTSDSIQASVDYQQFITSKSIHTTIVKNANYSAWYIISILNSKLLTYIYRCQTGEKGRTFAQVKLYDLRPLPIRKISFTTSPENRQAYLENTINLYQQYQINNKSDTILTQIDHHLNQQLSEADVIHDFLAYLAEQMIELNKQKQIEIKGFITWLERFISSPIDNLTNKSKIQNYLGDYYKETQSDNHLTLDELIEILNKNKKKLKIDITTRKEQEILEKEYQSSLNTLLPIKKQLKQCDWLIDEIIYRLYGLTEEEKAIIEQS